MSSASQRSVHPDLILGICCLSLLLVGMDVTIVNVALSDIQKDLHATLSQLQWVVDAYTLVVASFLILAGSMADRFGRRRVFQLGLSLFIFGSVLCSLAHSIGGLVAFRVVQALGASMLNPVALSIIANTFQERRARARALGIWGAVAGLSFALGPLVGGALTQSVGWRSIFWINLPIGIAALGLTAYFVQESKAERARPVDPVGQGLVLLTLMSLTYAVIEGPHLNWNSGVIRGLFLVAAGALIALLVYEPRRTDPLLDLRFFRSVPFSSATVIAACAFATFAGFLFLNTLYLQQVRGLSAFHAGLCTLPLALMTMVCAPISGKLVGTYGTRPPLLLAGVTLCLSTLLLTRLTAETSFPMLLTIYFIFGIGFGLVNAPISNTAVSGMPQAQAGVAAAIASTSRQVGAALGVAVSGTLAGAGSTLGPKFALATHPVWWIMAASGALIFLLGWISNTRWAQDSTKKVADLLGETKINKTMTTEPAHS
ncbi:multidrug resistance protein Stp [Abditibacteriota bacterium]|nr:multidrug resistance protein Stp [Abditibacteriota bacterium]